MFGTLKPLHGTLLADDQQRYQQFYCGLCKTLGDDHGQASRGMTGFDAIFLAILADALVDQGASPSSCRCPLLPLLRRPTLDETSAPMRFAASMQVLLADQLLADRAVDGRRGYRALRGLLSGRVLRAREVLAGQGVDLSDLTGFELVQARAEALGASSLDEAAAPTAQALASVFARVVHLPGASHRVRSSASRRALASLGAAVGRSIYWIDALEDLRKDFLGGEFNPCLGLDARGRLFIDQGRVAACVEALRADAERVERELRDLPLLRHRDLLRNILVEQLGARGRRAARLGEATSGASALLLLQREAGFFDGVQLRALALLAALWTFVAWLPRALAQQLPRLPASGKPPRPGPVPALPARDAGLDECPDGGALDGGALPERCRRPDGGLIDAGSGFAQGTGDAGAVDAGAPSPSPSSGGDADPCGLRGACRDACGGVIDALCVKPIEAICGGLCKSCSPDACIQGCVDSMCKQCCKACNIDACCKECTDSMCKQCCDSCKPDSCCQGCTDSMCKQCCQGCNLNGCCKCAEGVPVDTCGR